MLFIYVVLFFCCMLYSVDSKYVEGVLRTRENWAFLARFCFLSQEGQFEYEIEYNEDQGDINLLLYYDTEDQWPAVYKSNKTCQQKESVLSREQNQIINLTTWSFAEREQSGCFFLHQTEPKTTSTAIISVPTLPTTKVKGERTNIPTLSLPDVNDTTTESSYYDDSNYTTTEFYTTEYDGNNTATVEDFNTTDNPFVEVFETQQTTFIDSKVPIKKRYVKSYWYVRSGRTVHCHNARRFRSSRRRWWFIAVSNCNSTTGINLRYRILMTNGGPGDFWHEHFSADEFYILPVLVAFTIAYSFLMLAIVICSVELKSRQLLHSTYKIFVLSVILQLFGILFVTSYYLKLAISGLEPTKIKRLGLMLMGGSETTFLLLLLLLAKGYTVTRGRLPLAASVKLTIFMCLYIVTYVTIFIYEAKVFDPGEVLYLYESPAGYGLITLRVMAWCMFIYSTIFTLKHYPEKCNFYYPFNLFGTIWFNAGPAFILSANTYIDKWVRESIVWAVLLLIAYGGHLMFLILTTPSVANKNFPYHVRTTQIGIMEVNGSNTIEQFSHHMYEPSTTIREQTVIIPLTKRTEEIFEGMCTQRAFTKNSQNGFSQKLDEPPAKDTTIENVLSWSLAKKIPATELPVLQRDDGGSLGSESSVTPEHNNSLAILSRGSSFRQTLNGMRNQMDDYVKEVPIELFTVSKMVVMTNNNATKPQTEQ
nr:unnamed protein product [Callosobruchus analis]